MMVKAELLCMVTAIIGNSSFSVFTFIDREYPSHNTILFLILWKWRVCNRMSDTAKGLSATRKAFLLFASHLAIAHVLSSCPSCRLPLCALRFTSLDRHFSRLQINESAE